MVKKYTRNKEVISGKLDDELVMMDIDKGKYFALNPVATRIWELLEDPVTLQDICRQLMDEYDVPEDQCTREVDEYLKEMIKKGLVRISDNG